jgi:hypothetical protein
MIQLLYNEKRKEVTSMAEAEDPQAQPEEGRDDLQPDESGVEDTTSDTSDVVEPDESGAEADEAAADS